MSIDQNSLLLIPALGLIVVAVYLVYAGIFGGELPRVLRKIVFGCMIGVIISGVALFFLRTHPFGPTLIALSFIVSAIIGLLFSPKNQNQQ